FVGEADGRNFTFVHSGIGDRLLGDAVLLMNGGPVRDVIFAGTSGGLKNCVIGDIVAAESAFDGEGFSRYSAKDFSLSNLLQNGRTIPGNTDLTYHLCALKNMVSGNTPAVKKGDVFTIGSLLAETEENLVVLENSGFIGIEMELSAVYSAAAALGIRASGLLAVSDLPVKRPIWEALGTEDKRCLSLSIETIVETIMRFVGTCD
ncbi:MAG: hypothetical protein HQL28_06630, partial [Candidatus Omnitrophica bacterium]|nr:hypothetical protein [Candidatus Omnitrophota bacterium]